jgi:hypothetical protein
VGTWRERRRFLAGEELGDLLVGREAAELELREDLLAVHRNLEGAPLGFDELEARLGEDLLELSDQTGRLRQVVSLDAILNPDFHGAPERR